jgi:hypothetical protein
VPRNIAAIAAGIALSLSAGQLMAAKAVESTAVVCADLNWSAEVLASNPDIGAMCQTVYEKDGELFAKVSIVVTRIRGNKLTFRPIHVDGTRGDTRSVTLASDWRAKIGGREYRLMDMVAGQELNVYLPEDRFALSIGDDDAYISELVVIEDVEEETIIMPTTASPLFLVGLAGGAFLALGGVLSGLRRRRA